jgi:hypothetical protein
LQEQPVAAQLARDNAALAKALAALNGFANPIGQPLHIGAAGKIQEFYGALPAR